jgi:hypothetical protein
MAPAMAVGKELTQVPSFDSLDMSQFFAEEKAVVKRLKKAFLMVAGKAAQSFGPKLNDEQEILMNIADMIIEIYAAESTLLRVEKLVGRKGEAALLPQVSIAKVNLMQAADKIALAGKEAIASFTSGDEQKVMLMGLKRFTKMNPYNTKELRRNVAEIMVSKNAYSF